MKEHGMLMSGPMVRAYLAGLKKKTRRTRGLDLINENPDAWKFMGLKLREDGSLQALFERPIRTTMSETKWVKIPYGSEGDMLWFKETHAVGEAECVVYRADYLDGGEGAGSVVNLETGALAPLIWKPSIFMKRKYARIVTPVVSVRVERLQAITSEDALDEGIRQTDKAFYVELPDKHPAGSVSTNTAVGTYRVLWDALNFDSGLGWDKNPYVWVYEFKPKGWERNFPAEEPMELAKGTI